jgi:hypothetical protein
MVSHSCSALKLLLSVAGFTFRRTGFVNPG